MPAAGCFLRFFWIAGGHALLVILAVLIARGERWSLTARDGAYWTILGSMVLLRYVDWKQFDGATADGVPTNLRLFRRYAALLLASWSGIWTLAQSLELG